MNLVDLLDLCEAHSRLGDIISAQVAAVVRDGERANNQNRNGLQIAEREFIALARKKGVDVSAWDDAASRNTK